MFGISYIISVFIECCLFYAEKLSITPFHELERPFPGSTVTYQGEPARCTDELISASLSTEDPGKYVHLSTESPPDSFGGGIQDGPLGVGGSWL